MVKILRDGLHKKYIAQPALGMFHAKFPTQLLWISATCCVGQTTTPIHCVVETVGGISKCMYCAGQCTMQWLVKIFLTHSTQHCEKASSSNMTVYEQGLFSRCTFWANVCDARVYRKVLRVCISCVGSTTTLCYTRLCSLTCTSRRTRESPPLFMSQQDFFLEKHSNGVVCSKNSGTAFNFADASWVCWHCAVSHGSKSTAAISPTNPMALTPVGTCLVRLQRSQASRDTTTTSRGGARAPVCPVYRVRVCGQLILPSAHS